jgi:hypothetical protein
MTYIIILPRNGIGWNVILPCFNSQCGVNCSDYVQEMKNGRMMGSWRWQNLMLYHMWGTSLREPALISFSWSMYRLPAHNHLPPISSHYLPSFVEAYSWASWALLAEIMNWEVYFKLSSGVYVSKEFCPFSTPGWAAGPCTIYQGKFCYVPNKWVCTSWWQIMLAFIYPI